MNQASEKITVIVSTPLKRNGKSIAPDTELTIPVAEAAPLLAVKAVLVRDHTNTHDEAAEDPAGTAPGAAGEAHEKETGADEADGPGAQPSAEAPVNVNMATAEQIANAANGIGLNTARDLVKWRMANGDFASLDDLTRVRGIGQATVDRNRDALTV